MRQERVRPVVTFVNYKMFTLNHVFSFITHLKNYIDCVKFKMTALILTVITIPQYLNLVSNNSFENYSLKF